MTKAHAPASRGAGTAAAIDLVLILVFAALGRMSHDEGGLVLGVWATAWPFVVAAAIGWGVLLLWRAPLSMWRAVLLAAITVSLGMLLRLATGAGAALPFVIVASGVLLAFFVAWRAIFVFARWQSARRRASSA